MVQTRGAALAQVLVLVLVLVGAALAQVESELAVVAQEEVLEEGPKMRSKLLIHLSGK
jgi:hypothetical protein